MTLRTDADARAYLDAGVRALAPRMQRALLAYIESLRSEGVSLARIAALVERRLEVAQVVVDDGVPRLVVPDFPDAALAFTATPGVVAIATTNDRARAFLTAVVDGVREAERRAAGALPPMPPRRPPMPGAPDPDPGRVPRRLSVGMTPGIPGAADAAVRYAGTAYQYLAAELQAGVREAVEEGLRQGRNPRDIARGIRDVVGLGPGQARWVANLRDELTSGDLRAALDRKMLRGPVRQTVAAAARAGRALTAAQVDKVVGAYRQIAINERAETIARTMALDLLREGQLAQLRAAVQRGDYAGLVVLKQWVTTLDGREREAHRRLNGRRVPLNGTWNDDGVLRQVPGGWRCRCATRYIPVPDADAARLLAEEPAAPAVPAIASRTPDLPPATTNGGGVGGGVGGGGNGGGTPPSLGGRDGGGDMPAPRPVPSGAILDEAQSPASATRALLSSLDRARDTQGRVVDVTGLPVIADERMTRGRRGGSKATKRERGQYLPLVAETILDPDEIFLLPPDPGGFASQRRYLARWDAGDDGIVHIVAAARELAPGEWRFVTGYQLDDPTVAQRVSAYAALRSGVRVYRRPE